MTIYIDADACPVTRIAEDIARKHSPGERKAGGQMKTALIMEGGAMRGMFTCGVMDVLMKNGIAFDGAAGISAGAVVYPG